ncbi:MAG: 4Fe-4S binding protein [Spirochaetes bacterium]|nr:4Fe-4S binding protein [Spirochaetota bacterium]
MSKRPGWWLYILAKIWPITWLSAQATQSKIIGPIIAKTLVPFFSKKNLNITYLPINITIAPQSTPVPLLIVEEIIRRSAHRAIIKRCTCRDAKGCSQHPIEYGCLLMGQGAQEIDPRIASHVSVEEAIDHLHKCVAEGLIPMVGRVKIDNLIWGVKDTGRLLTMCFCCRCCCTILNSGKYLPQEAASSIVRLKGVELRVDLDSCTGCGTCVDECFMDAIRIVDGKAFHNDAICKGCGRCAQVCPQQATTITVADIDAAIEEMSARIKQYVQYE